MTIRSVSTLRSLQAGSRPSARIAACLSARTMSRATDPAAVTSPGPGTLRINGAKLMNALNESCVWGSIPSSTGMNRLSLSDDDKSVRNWFRSKVEGMGCIYKVDEMGNQFGTLPGINNNLPPIAMGSHLDTQPAGGRYDGILGVLSGLETLRTIREAGYKTYAPLAVINWTNEEGARFPVCMCSSGVWSQNISLERAHSLTDLNGKTMKDELARIGYLGSLECSHNATPLSAHFEVHIEQGPILERENKMIGIVEGVQAMRWYQVEIRGREAHTGTTPMGARCDALLTAAHMITAVNRVALEHDGLGTVGVIQSWPQSVNTIPVKFSVDLRHVADQSLSDLETAVSEELRAIANKFNAELTFEKTWDSPAVHFHADNIACVEKSVQSAGFTSRRIRSGAGHDSVYTSKIVPTSMIFCPSKDGISHNPAEHSTDEECAAAAQTLCGAVLYYDELLRTRHG